MKQSIDTSEFFEEVRTHGEPLRELGDDINNYHFMGSKAADVSIYWDKSEVTVHFVFGQDATMDANVKHDTSGIFELIGPFIKAVVRGSMR